MILKNKMIGRAILPVTVFVVVMAAHYVWLGFFSPEARWVAIDASGNWFRRYLETQGYWMGYSYALSLAFAAVALRRYREERFCGARNLSIAGVTFSGFLAAAGCYLLGCCGSPMLIVYLNLLGTSFLPLAKPLLATMTTLTILGAWVWMNRRRQQASSPTSVEVAIEKNEECNCR